jgi:hypothetical protein
MEQMSIKKLANTYPMLLGVSIGLLIFGTIIIIETCFPRGSKAWAEHNSVVRSAWFTIGFFLLCINRYWRWRRRVIFWVSAAGFLLVHAVLIIYYAIYIHAPTLQEWILLFIVESFVVVFGMDFLSRKFSLDPSGGDRG